MFLFNPWLLIVIINLPVLLRALLHAENKMNRAKKLGEIIQIYPHRLTRRPFFIIASFFTEKFNHLLCLGFHFFHSALNPSLFFLLCVMGSMSLSFVIVVVDTVVIIAYVVIVITVYITGAFSKSTATSCCVTSCWFLQGILVQRFLDLLSK